MMYCEEEVVTTIQPCPRSFGDTVANYYMAIIIFLIKEKIEKTRTLFHKWMIEVNNCN